MDTPSLHILDYLIIGASLVLSVAVGVRFAKAQSTTAKYFAAGRNVPVWAIGLSIFATLISSITFLAYPGDGFAGNWVRLVQ
ncbi:MAG: sodium transporter, partial [Chloroflexota bacterium]|nr:sodium transporter [Chloroflexota bacterium]